MIPCKLNIYTPPIDPPEPPPDCQDSWNSTILATHLENDLTNLASAYVKTIYTMTLYRCDFTMDEAKFGDYSVGVFDLGYTGVSVKLTSGGQNAAPMSVSFFFQTEATADGVKHRTLFLGGYSSTKYMVVYLDKNTNEIMLNSNWLSLISSGVFITDNEWHHLEINCDRLSSTVTAGTIRVYLDGIEIIEVSEDILWIKQQTRIGGGYSSSIDGVTYSAINGYIDDIQLKQYSQHSENFTPPSGSFFEEQCSVGCDPYWDYTDTIHYFQDDNALRTFKNDGRANREGEEFEEEADSPIPRSPDEGRAHLTVTDFSYGVTDLFIPSYAITFPRIVIGREADIWNNQIVIEMFLKIPNTSDCSVTNGSGNSFTTAFVDNVPRIRTSSATTYGPTHPTNEWFHLALIHSGTGWGIAVNGIVGGFSTEDSKLSGFDLGATGAFVDQTDEVYGNNIHIAAFRLTLGSTRGYTSNFDVPTLPYPLKSC